MTLSDVLALRSRRAGIADQGEPDVQGHHIDETLRTVIARHLDVPPTELTTESSLEELGLDDDLASLMLGAVGDELELRFPDDFLDGLDTYGKLHSAVLMAVGA